MQHIEELFASRLKAYCQMPPDHIWLLIESELDMDNTAKSKNNMLQKLLMKFRIVHS